MKKLNREKKSHTADCVVWFILFWERKVCNVSATGPLLTPDRLNKNKFSYVSRRKNVHSFFLL